MIVGVGIDAVDIERIERMFSKNADRMRARLFTEGELAYLATEGLTGAASGGASRRERGGVQGADWKRPRAEHLLARHRGLHAA